MARTDVRGYTAGSELVADAGDEFEVVLEPSYRGLILKSVLHDQAQVEGFVDRRGDTRFAVENPILELVHLWNPFCILPYSGAGLKFVFAPLGCARAKVTARLQAIEFFIHIRRPDFSADEAVGALEEVIARQGADGEPVVHVGDVIVLGIESQTAVEAFRKKV